MIRLPPRSKRTDTLLPYTTALPSTESAAICERIAEGTPLEVRRDEADYWDARNWLHRSDATLTFPLAIMIRYTRVEPEDRRLAQAVADYKAFFGGRAKSIEAALADGRDWLVAGRFTVVDIEIGRASGGVRGGETGMMQGVAGSL